MIHRGFRYKIDPTTEQEAMFRQFAGVCRFVYNLALEQRRDWWRLVDSALLDEPILAACKVRNNKTGQSWWEMHSVCVHSETGEITSETDAGWSIDDYSHFMSLPSPPKEHSQ